MAGSELCRRVSRLRGRRNGAGHSGLGGGARRPVDLSNVRSLTGGKYAEGYHHQQYLARNINGYYGIGGTGVTCPIDVAGATVHVERDGNEGQFA